MPTRFYLPSSGTPGASPAFGGTWNVAPDTQPHLPLVTTKSGTALTALSHAETVTTNPAKHPIAQFVSDPLAAQTLAGNISGVVLGHESSTSANASLALAVYVVSGDGLTARGTMYTPGSGFINTTTVADVWGSEFGTADSTRTIPSTALTSVTCLDGDRLVIELGSRNENSVTTSYTTFLTFGDPTGTADYARTPGLTTSLDPWVEFDSTIAFSSGSSFAGSLGLTGSGVLSFAATVALAGSLALTGSGALGLSGTPSASGTLALTGSSALTMTGSPSASGALALSGGGSLVLAGAPAASGALPLSGAGSLALSGSASGNPSGTLALTGTGGLVLAGKPTISGSLALTGSGSLGLVGAPSSTGALTLSGSGALALAGAAMFASSPAPRERTVVVGADARLLVVGAEGRLVVVGAESRTIAIPIEGRTVGVPAEDRTVRIT